MEAFYNENSMDFDEYGPLQDTQQSQDPQTQSTQEDNSQQQDDLERHLWGALIPCNSHIARVDLWKIQTTYCVGRNPQGNQIVFPGPKISQSSRSHVLRLIAYKVYTGNFHCQMTWDGNDSQDSVVTVLDLSSNGTYVGVSGAARFFLKTQGNSDWWRQDWQALYKSFEGRK